MALHHDAVETEEDRTIMIIGIKMMPQKMHGRLGNQEADLRADGAGEGIAQHVGDEARGAFRRLERDIAGETIGDDHVRFARAELVALDEAIEAQLEAVSAAQHGSGIANLVRALELFRADVEQAHARRLDIEHDSRIGRAHDREFDEVAGIALGVRTEIEHHHIILAEGRQQCGERGSINAGERAQGELGDGHQRTGVAGGDGGMRLAVLHGLDGQPHGAAARLANRLARLVRGSDHAISVENLDAA